MCVYVCECVCSPGQTHSTMLLPVIVRYSIVQSQHIHKRVYTTALETLLDHAGWVFLFLFHKRINENKTTKKDCRYRHTDVFVLENTVIGCKVLQILPGQTSRPNRLQKAYHGDSFFFFFYVKTKTTQNKYDNKNKKKMQRIEMTYKYKDDRKLLDQAHLG